MEGESEKRESSERVNRKRSSQIAWEEERVKEIVVREDGKEGEGDWLIDRERTRKIFK